MTHKMLIFSLLPFLYLIIMLLKIDASLMVDLGRQLKMGEVIYTCQCIPQVNFFSSLHPDFPSVNHSWLSQVIFYLLDKTFGLTSLLYFKMVLVLFTFSLIYVAAFRKESIFASVMCGLFSAALFSDRFLVRPELFSYFFLALSILVYEMYKRRQQMLVLWFIPLIIVAWVNAHIYFFIGVLLFVFFLAEQLAVHKRLKPGFLPLAVTVLLSPLVNPAFIQGATYPFTIFFNYGVEVMENYPPLLLIAGNYAITSEIISIVVFELLSIIALAGVLILPRKKFVFDKLGSVLGIILGQVLNRCTSLFAFLGVPFLIKEYAYIERHVAPEIRGRVMKGIRILLISLFSLIVIFQIKDGLTYPVYGFYFENSYERGVEFFRGNDLKGPIFNNGAAGNYLIYKLYPEEKVFVDGRPEAYPASFLKEYERMLQDHTYFNQQMDAYKVNVVFMGLLDYPTLTRPFLQRLSEDRRWAPVFWDGTVAIFVRNISENAEIINNHKNVQEKLFKDLK